MTKPSTPAAGLSQRGGQRVPWWRRIFTRRTLFTGVNEAQLLERFSLDDSAADCIKLAFNSARVHRYPQVTLVDVIWAMVQRDILTPLLTELDIDKADLEPQ